MAFEELIGCSYGLMYTDVEPDANDNVELEIDSDPTSPTFNHIKPVVGVYTSYTQQGIDIDWGASYGSTSDGGQAGAPIPTNAFLDKAEPAIKTLSTFNRDPNVMALTRLPGQDLGYQFWFGSTASVREHNLLIAEYNRLRDRDGNAIDVVLIWLILRGYFKATRYKIIPTHEPIETIFTILKGYQYGSRTCFRTDNDLGTAWYVDKFNPTIRTFPDGRPLSSVTPRPVYAIEPNGIMVL